MEREVLLDVRDLDVTFGERRKKYEAVKKVNFKIYKGETFGLVGESGSGKTTIGRAIMVGDMEIQITDYNPVNRRIYEVGEKAYLDFDPKGVYIL